MSSPERYDAPDCPHVRYVTNLCGSRACPSCGKKVTDPWIATQLNRLPDCDQVHLVFTLPDTLWPRFPAQPPYMKTLWLGMNILLASLWTKNKWFPLWGKCLAYVIAEIPTELPLDVCISGLPTKPACDQSADEHQAAYSLQKCNQYVRFILFNMHIIIFILLTLNNEPYTRWNRINLSGCNIYWP